jgi:hypothetical protein
VKPSTRFNLRLIWGFIGITMYVAKDWVGEPFKTFFTLVASGFIGSGVAYFAAFPFIMPTANGRGMFRFTWDSYRELKQPMIKCAGCGRWVLPTQEDAAKHAILKVGGRACSAPAE